MSEGIVIIILSIILLIIFLWFSHQRLKGKYRELIFLDNAVILWSLALIILIIGTIIKMLEG